MRAFLFILLATATLFLVPEFAAAGQQQFRLERPDAQRVELLGEFNQWKAQPMKKESDGSWTLTISIPPGTYGYKFLVNGSEWAFDPKNPKRKTVDSIENSMIEIAGGSSTVLPASSPPVPLAIKPAITPAQTVTSNSPVSSSTSSLAPTPGEVLKLEVPLSVRRAAEADKGVHLTKARLAIAVPKGFDPQKSWPVLIINNTLDASNIDSMNQFKQAALEAGWIIMAADPMDTEKGDKGGWRWPTIAAAMDYLTAAWPAAKDWPIAVGGMSGGGKNSAFIAADFARERHRLIGILMMGCNQDMATVAFHKSAPPNFLGVPVFLSSGKSDTIATPSQHEDVKSSLRATGFQKVRLESFAGAHDIYQPHITESLEWFVAESVRNAPAQRSSSDFDKFFKKKP
jgi:hypothetical protein